MIIERKEGSKTIRQKLKYFNGEVNLQNLSSASIIYPNYEFWMPYFGIREVEELDWKWVLESNDRIEFYENDWVEKQLWIKTYDMCGELQIDPIHLHNIAVPLSHYPMASLSLIGQDIDKVAEDVLKLQNLFISLENNAKKKVRSIRFVVEELVDINVEEGSIYDQPVEVEINKDRAIDPFMNALQRLARSDVSLNSHIYNEDILKFRKFQLESYYKNRRNDLVKMLLQYLVDHDLCKSVRDGTIKTGQFISLVDEDYVGNKKHYEEIYKGHSSYANYEDYVYNRLKQNIKRHPISEHGTT